MQTIRINLLRQFGLFIALTCATLFSSPSLAQVCATGGAVILSTQALVNSFQSDYGACDTMADNLTISGADITDLSPLGLTTVSASAQLIIDGNATLATLNGLALTGVYWLEVRNNPALTSIDGLSSLIGGAGGGPIVLIDNNDALSNVDGLSGLTSLTFGTLRISNNDGLTDLSGVSNITSIGGSLEISNNDLLTDLDDLSALSNVSSVITISDNAALTSINGLAGISGSINGFNILRNPLLASLQGLNGVTSASTVVIDNNASLTNLDPLSNITSIGNVSGLVIRNNTALTDIMGLGNIEGSEWTVAISGNTALSQCSILQRLLDAVDDFDSGPGPGSDGVPDVLGDITISGNLAGCNSIADIVGSAPPTTYTVGGSISGLTGSVTLQNNGADNLVRNANGSFTFATALAASSAYAVTVFAQPSGQTCSVASGSGTITTGNVTGVSVTCANDPITPPGTPPGATQIPTLSVYGLVLTILGLLLVAGRRLQVLGKQKKSEKPNS